jgi:hypothetical protein
MFGEPRRANSDWKIGFVPRAPLCGLHGSDEPAYFGERFDLVPDVGVADNVGRSDGEEPDHRNDSECDDGRLPRALRNKHALGRKRAHCAHGGRSPPV